MPPLRLVATLGVAGALLGGVAVATAATSPGPANVADSAVYRGPVASASGGDAAALLPSIVNNRLVRGEAALARAATLVDQGKPASAVPEINAAQANMTAAWTGAQYVIRTTPPPVAGDGAFAHSSGGAVAGAYATPQDTAFAVFGLQHDVVTMSIGLLGSGNAALETKLQAAITAAADARDAAVAYIHTIAPPPVAGDGAFAHSSGGAVAGDWGTSMQQVVTLLGDELQVVRATRQTSTTISPSTSTWLVSVRGRDLKTQANINKYWPPVVDD
jgi:hypothetical protein